LSDPNGIRTRVTGVRGRRPEPLDDGTIGKKQRLQYRKVVYLSNVKLAPGSLIIGWCLGGAPFALSESEQEIDRHADEREQADDYRPHGLHLDGPEVLGGDIQNSQAGQEKEGNASDNDDHAGAHYISAFQFFGDFKDGVHIIFAVIVMIDRPVCLFPGNSRSPAEVFQIARDAGDGIRVDEEVHAAVMVAVAPVEHDVGGHELGNAHRAGIGTLDRRGVHTFPLRVSQEGFEFAVSPGRFLIRLPLKLSPCDSPAVVGQAFPDDLAQLFYVHG
jgi:hypothetical protein